MLRVRDSSMNLMPLARKLLAAEVSYCKCYAAYSVILSSYLFALFVFRRFDFGIVCYANPFPFCVSFICMSYASVHFANFYVIMAVAHASLYS